MIAIFRRRFGKSRNQLLINPKIHIRARKIPISIRSKIELNSKRMMVQNSLALKPDEEN